MQFLRALCVVATALVLQGHPAAAQQLPTSASTGSELTVGERAAVARDLIAKWQGAVKMTPGGDVGSWSTKLKKAVASADAANVLSATTMRTLDAMHGALNGFVPADSSAIQSPADSGIAPQALGSTTADTTYTPLPKGRCRVADSRVVNSALPAGVTRGIDIELIASYSAQGGNGTYANGDGSANCGIPDFVTAFAISVTLLSPSADGVFKAFKNGQPSQTGNSILFNAGDFGANGDLNVVSCQACAKEISISSSAKVHYVIDVLGYFMPPLATALQCMDTTETSTTLAARSQGSAVAPLCPSGYTHTSTNCNAASWNMPLVFSKAGKCAAQNNGTVAAAIKASRTCCRVPGR